jgi:hypothetical protein
MTYFLYLHKIFIYFLSLLGIDLDFIFLSLLGIDLDFIFLSLLGIDLFTY